VRCDVVVGALALVKGVDEIVGCGEAAGEAKGVGCCDGQGDNDDEESV
jgi:hypothetical protein